MFYAGERVDDSSPFSIVIGTFAFFAFSAVIWMPLYTWMVVVMLLWGRGRSIAEIRTLYQLSPVLLACAMAIPAMLLDLPEAGEMFLWGFLRLSHMDPIIPVFLQREAPEQIFRLGLAWVLMAAPCVFIGYTFVSAAELLEKVLDKRGFFLPEADENAFASAALRAGRSLEEPDISRGI